METVVYLIAALAAVGAIGILIRNWYKWRGERVITCPDNQRPAGVQVDAWRAALSLNPQLRLTECSRWPEKQSCGQECLRQIENSPEGCLVRNILTRWYADKNCIFCRKPLGDINWLERKPALIDPEGKTLEWSELRAENAPEALAIYRPVCWDCHIVETFRRHHPELVVERPR